MNNFSTVNNIHYTNALFLEKNSTDPELAIYTLASDDITIDGKTYISLRKQYLLLEDPTEYAIASKYFDNWTHWKKVKESSKLKDDIDEWREELEVKLRSKGVKGVYNKALEGDYQASKWLAERGFSDKKVRRAGAPSKEAVLEETRKAAKVQGIFSAHADRMKRKER